MASIGHGAAHPTTRKARSRVNVAQGQRDGRTERRRSQPAGRGRSAKSIANMWNDLVHVPSLDAARSRGVGISRRARRSGLGLHRRPRPVPRGVVHGKDGTIGKERQVAGKQISLRLLCDAGRLCDNGRKAIPIGTAGQDLAESTEYPLAWRFAVAIRGVWAARP